MRLIRRYLLPIAASVTLAGTLAIATGAAPAGASSGIKCAFNSAYGTTCINIQGQSTAVWDVIGYFVPPNNDFFSSLKWGLRLEEYSCNPINTSLSNCNYFKSWNSSTRTGNPPAGGSTCTSVSAGSSDGSVTLQECQDWGLAQEEAIHGNYPGFYITSTQTWYAPNDTWLCVEAQSLSGTTWVPNGGVNGNQGKRYRGCAEIKA